MRTVINDNWDKPATELIGYDRLDNIDIGEDISGFYMETPESGGPDNNMVILADEYLHFATGNGDLDGLIDEDGWLTREAIDVTTEVLREMFADDQYNLPADIIDTLYADDGLGGDEPVITFSVARDVTTCTVKELFEETAEPFYAGITNVTDPGTFNHMYLWDEVRRRMGLD